MCLLIFLGNVAYHKPTLHSTEAGDIAINNPASNAVDGILDGDNLMFAATAHRDRTDPDPATALPAWWRVDLGALHVIDQMIITNRVESWVSSGIYFGFQILLVRAGGDSCIFVQHQLIIT